jgi:hypothetical protein
MENKSLTKTKRKRQTSTSSEGYTKHTHHNEKKSSKSNPKKVKRVKKVTTQPRTKKTATSPKSKTSKNEVKVSSVQLNETKKSTITFKDKDKKEKHAQTTSKHEDKELDEKEDKKMLICLNCSVWIDASPLPMGQTKTIHLDKYSLVVKRIGAEMIQAVLQSESNNHTFAMSTFQPFLPQMYLDIDTIQGCSVVGRVWTQNEIPDCKSIFDLE